MPRRASRDRELQLPDTMGETDTVPDGLAQRFFNAHSKKKRFSMPESILKRRIVEHQQRQRGRDDTDLNPHPPASPMMSTLSIPIVTIQPSTPCLTKQRKSMQEDLYLLKANSDGDVQASPVRRKSFDVAADGTERRPSVIGSLMSRINLTNMKKSDQTKSGNQTTSSGSSLAAGGTTTTNNNISHGTHSGGGGGGGSGGSNSSSSKTTTTSQAPRASPLMGKKSLPLPGEMNFSNSGGGGGGLGGGGQTISSMTSHSSLGGNSAAGGGGGGVGSALAGVVGGSLLQEDGQPSTLSSEDLLLDNGSDTGTDEVDSGEGSGRTKQVIASLHAKIQKTRDAIRKEQNNKESIVNEYLQMAAEKTPTARIKTLFEKKNQKSAQNIISLQRKLESYQHRLTEVETHGYTGHKQAKEVLRDVGQGLNTIVSKPKEFAHLIKNKFGSADNITQLKLEDQGVTETDGKTGGTLPASFKYTSDDENSSITSGSGPHAGGLLMGSPGHTASGGGGQHQVGGQGQLQMVTLTPGALDPVMKELKEVKESNRRVSEVLLRQAEEFEDHRAHMQSEMSLLRSQLEDERFRVERLEEQLNDLTELHQHEILNLRQDLSSTEEKIEYRLDERTTDLSDLVDNTSTRISRLEQQQQQQQILSMEMVENATFRTIISKLINVVLALLAVVLVCVSTAAKFLSPFLHSTPRLVLSLLTALLAWLIYHYMPNIQASGSWLLSVFSSPWS